MGSKSMDAPMPAYKYNLPGSRLESDLHRLLNAKTDDLMRRYKGIGASLYWSKYVTSSSVSNNSVYYLVRGEIYTLDGSVSFPINEPFDDFPSDYLTTQLMLIAG